MESWLGAARRRFHAECLAGPITVTGGVPSIADVASAASRDIAIALVARLGDGRVTAAKPAGQTAGQMFEAACLSFLTAVLARLQHVRPGVLTVARGRTITQFDQYAHLEDLRQLAAASRELRTHLGSDYLIKPDVVVIRDPVTDATLNSQIALVDDGVALLSPLRGMRPTLHASISCKLTIRSDRVQNTRSEALNLMRNRKGRLPHIAAVTAEPAPSRIAAIALGTGDIDCVYHLALTELVAVLRDRGGEPLELVETMIAGNRLRDIADLPLDLVI